MEKRRAHLVDILSRSTHAIVQLYALPPHIDYRTRPMRVAMVNWDEHHVLREYVDLSMSRVRTV